MKITCAWCGEVLGFKCNACGKPLTKVLLDGHYVVACLHGLTKTYFVNPSVMEQTHTICNPCLEAAGRSPITGNDRTLSDEDRANLAAYCLPAVGRYRTTA